MLRPSTFSSSLLLPGITSPQHRQIGKPKGNNRRGLPVGVTVDISRISSLHHPTWGVVPTWATNLASLLHSGIGLDVEIGFHLHHHPGRVRVREGACATSTRTLQYIHHKHSTDLGAGHQILVSWSSEEIFSLIHIYLYFVCFIYLDSEKNDLLPIFYCVIDVLWN